MKRREHILVVSLELFNNEGEASLSAVDIANELDISPGNLYYHFKGKEEIVAELFARFEDKLQVLLRDVSELQSADSLENNWLNFYLILEQIYSYRFFYRNLNDLLQKYRELERPFNRLIDLKYQYVRSLFQHLLAEGVFETGKMLAVGVDDLAEGVVLTMIYWFNYQDLRKRALDRHGFIQSAVMQVMAQVAPYIAESEGQFMAECHELYQQEIEKTTLTES